MQTLISHRVLTVLQLRIDHDNYLPRLYKFCEDMHRYGTKVSIQINHAGASAMSSRIGGLQPVSASNIPSKTGGATPRPLTKTRFSLS